MSLFHAMLTHSILSPLQMSILNLLFFISDKSRESLLHCRSWSGQPGKLKAILCLLWSIRYFKLLFQKSIPFCLQHWADILCWQQKAKNLKWKCIHTFASALANNNAKSFCDTNGSQIGKHFKQHYEHGSILCGKRKFSLLFKFKLPVNPRILYIPFSNSILGTKGRELKDKWCRILLRLRVQARMNSFLKHKMLLQYERVAKTMPLFTYFYGSWDLLYFSNDNRPLRSDLDFVSGMWLQLHRPVTVIKSRNKKILSMFLWTR